MDKNTLIVKMMKYVYLRTTKIPNVYKIGRSGQSKPQNRSEANNTKTICLIVTYNDLECEKYIKCIFKNNFELHKGHEFFIGDINLVLYFFQKAVFDFNNNYSKNIIKYKFNNEIDNIICSKCCSEYIQNIEEQVQENIEVDIDNISEQIIIKWLNENNFDLKDNIIQKFTSWYNNQTDLKCINDKLIIKKMSEYFTSDDYKTRKIDKFLNEVCIVNPSTYIPVSSLYEKYISYSNEKITIKMFGSLMRKCGYISKSKRFNKQKNRVYEGLFMKE